MGNDIKERRKHMRIALISESCFWFDDQGKISHNSMTDINVGGVFIKSEVIPKSREKVVVRFHLPGELGNLNLAGVVVWKRWAVPKDSKLPKGFAVEFVGNKPAYIKVLEAYCIYLRNRQIIKVSKRIIDEFFPKDINMLPDGVQ